VKLSETQASFHFFHSHVRLVHMTHITDVVNTTQKYLGTTNCWLDGGGWCTQSILKRNKHWSTTPATSITFGLRHTEALDNGRKMVICEKHQTDEAPPNKLSEDAHRWTKLYSFFLIKASNNVASGERRAWCARTRTFVMMQCKIR